MNVDFDIDVRRDGVIELWASEYEVINGRRVDEHVTALIEMSPEEAHRLVRKINCLLDDLEGAADPRSHGPDAADEEAA